AFALFPLRVFLPCFPTRRSSDLLGILQVAQIVTLARQHALVPLGFGRNQEAAGSPCRSSNACKLSLRVAPACRGPIASGEFGSLDRKSTRLNSSHVKISYAVLHL